MPTLLSCDGAGVCSVIGMPVINQSDPRIAKSTYGKKTLADCYDTAILSVIIPVLASRDKRSLAAPGGRTAMIENIPATPGIPKQLNQLAALQETAGTEKAFYCPEVIADFEAPFQKSPDPRKYSGDAPVLFTSNHGAAFRDWLTPSTTHLADTYVKTLMKNDFAVMLGVYWTKPSVENGKAMLNVEGPHKMAVSGFREHKYPLRINHIYNAAQSWARLVRIDEATRSFGAEGLTSKSIDPASLAKLSSQTYLEFENDVGPMATLPVVTQIDPFSLNWQAPRRSVDGRWSTGWTHFVPFSRAGKPHLIGYNQVSGDVHFDRIVSGGSETLWSGRWDAGWTHLIPFTVQGAAHLLAYNSATGLVHIDRVCADCRGVEGIWVGNWERGFTHFSPFVLDGSPHFIAYNATTGRVHFDKISDTLQGARTRFEATWGPGWSTLMPFVMNGQPHFLAYNVKSGAATFNRIGRTGAFGGAGKGNDLFLTILGETRWGSGWSHFAAAQPSSVPHFFAYNAATGQIHYDRFGMDGASTASVWIGTTSKGFSSAVTLAATTDPTLLLFNKLSGELAYYVTAPPF